MPRKSNAGRPPSPQEQQAESQRRWSECRWRLLFAIEALVMSGTCRLSLSGAPENTYSLCQDFARSGHIRMKDNPVILGLCVHIELTDKGFAALAWKRTQRISYVQERERRKLERQEVGHNGGLGASIDFGVRL